MSKVYEAGEIKIREDLEIAEKERDRDLQGKINGLSSETIILSEYFPDVMETLEAHWNADLKEVVIVKTRALQSEGDIAYESEVVTSFYKIHDFILYANTH